MSEVTEQGIVGPVKTRGGVSFKAAPPKAFELILRTRIASRIFLKIDQFDIKNEDDLYAKSFNIPWEDYLTTEDTFKFSTLFDLKSKERFRNSMFISLRMKDALVDRMNEKFDKRPSVDTKYPEISFLLRLESDGYAHRALVLLDLCGEPLSNRGYRESGHSAPLRENLAAAMVMLSNFDKETDKFFDPMCGSGTILIEALLYRAGISPSYLHLRRYIERDQTTYAFLKQRWFKDDNRMVAIWNEIANRIYEENGQLFSMLQPDQFVGTDINHTAIAEARISVKKATLTKFINLDVADARTVAPPFPAPAIVMTNPPYGQRLGKDEDLAKLYFDFTENLKKNYKGFRAYIIAERNDTVKAIALKPSRKTELWNGPIECRLFRYDLY